MKKGEAGTERSQPRLAGPAPAHYVQQQLGALGLQQVLAIDALEQSGHPVGCRRVARIGVEFLRCGLLASGFTVLNATKKMTGFHRSSGGRLVTPAQSAISCAVERFTLTPSMPRARMRDVTASVPPAVRSITSVALLSLIIGSLKVLAIGNRSVPFIDMRRPVSRWIAVTPTTPPATVDNRAISRSSL
jgi:hypothetical protein